MTEQTDKFKFYRYFSNKFILPIIAMLIWAILIYSGKLTGDKMVFGVGVGLLCFSGMFSLQSIAEKYVGGKNE